MIERTDAWEAWLEEHGAELEAAEVPMPPLASDWLWVVWDLGSDGVSGRGPTPEAAWANAIRTARRDLLTGVDDLDPLPVSAEAALARWMAGCRLIRIVGDEAAVVACSECSLGECADVDGEGEWEEPDERLALAERTALLLATLPVPTVRMLAREVEALVAEAGDER